MVIQATAYLRILLAGLFCAAVLQSAPVVRAQSPAERPKLVVVISLDQFRYDYLPRFAEHFGEGGFNRFLQRGATFANARYEHAITKTAPGHAVILSGTYANVNGIISNDWYNVAENREEYCVLDEEAPLIGAPGEGRSPKNFTATTVGDVLKESTAGRSKVIAMSNKDRSAILMGGKLADGAYWMIDSVFVTSTYYMGDVPEWVKQFNRSGAVASYLGKSWARVLPETAYAFLGPDDAPSEEAEDGLSRVFPHNMGAAPEGMGELFFAAFDQSPFSSEVLADFATQAIVNEQLGQRGVTDLIAIGFSANDRIGHAFGPNSHEVMDITIRTDRILEGLFDFIDEQVGQGNWVAVLTADHGAAPLPEVILAQNPHAQAGRVDPATILTAVTQALDRAFGASPMGWISYHGDPFIYLNPLALAQQGAAAADAEQVVKDTLMHVPAVHHVYTHTELAKGHISGGLAEAVLYSFHPTRTGNIFYQLNPYYLEDDEAAGTSHGSPWSYDAHVPVLWYGAGVKPGTYYEAAGVADIAPTLSALLNIGYPAGSQGRVLHEMLVERPWDSFGPPTD